MDTVTYVGSMVQSEVITDERHIILSGPDKSHEGMDGFGEPDHEGCGIYEKRSR